MNVRVQILCAWAGLLCPLFFFIGLLLPGFFPPTDPRLGAEAIAAIYHDNSTAIRLGGFAMILSGGLYAAFTAAVSTELRRIEENNLYPVLTYTQLAAGAATSLLFLLTPMVWATATFRLDRDPEITQALNDLAWILIFMPYAILTVQMLSVGIAILNDKKNNPVFPRWLGFLNILFSLVFIPEGFVPFFKSGPFAWNGLIVFWVPSICYGIWLNIMSMFLIKSAKRYAASAENEGRRVA